ncbi:MAG: AAA family ATPase [Phycisphaeraceae bacterium]|nr:AAA family ATPase [Phycisphaeraceae bacterium]
MPATTTRKWPISASSTSSTRSSRERTSGARAAATISTPITTPRRLSTRRATSTGIRITRRPRRNWSAWRRATARGAAASDRCTARASHSSSCSSPTSTFRSTSAERRAPSQEQPVNDTESGDLAGLEQLKAAHERIRGQIARVIVGQEQVVDLLLTSIFARGHCILEGVPGLAKTLLVSTLAQSLSLRFTRIQFTPDLMPSDITGTEVMQEDRSTGSRHFTFVHGPLFTNVLLADEINRTPPKTQAALLEGMQERQVSAGGKRYPLPEPFFVLATQNPIEQEGTYPLPEAQLDRFLFKVFVDYPTAEEERSIYRMSSTVDLPEPVPVLNDEQIAQLQETVRRIPVSDYVLDYAMALVRATRRDAPEAPQFVRDWVLWGAGPRGGQALVLAAKARAALDGRPEVAVDDVTALARPVLRHRLVLNYNAEAEGQTPDTVIERLLETVAAHDRAETSDGRIERVLKA